MEDTGTGTQRFSRGVFASLDGTPAHVLIIVGLALTLLAPLILSYKGAGLMSAQAEFENLKAFKELDLEEFKRQQDDQRKKSPEFIKYKQAADEVKPATLDFTLPPEIRDALRQQEQEKDKAVQELKKAVDDRDKERKDALEKKQEELDQKYNTINPRREIAEAMTAVAGTRSHLVLAWLGRLLLLLGLLVLTVQSEGVKQKVLLIVLLVVMFSALSGVNLDFEAQGRMGGPPPAAERAPQAPPAPK